MPRLGSAESEPLGTSDRYQGSGRAFTVNELATLKECYRTAAQRAQQIGAAGVEVHAGHGYLLDQFLWPDTNRRTDGYGGPDIRQRVRFAAEVVASYAKRRATTSSFPSASRSGRCPTTALSRPSTPMQRSSTPGGPPADADELA